MNFEDFLRELALVDASDNIETVIDLVNGYYNDLSILKMTNNAKYERILTIPHLSESTYKALKFLAGFTNEKHLPIIPVVNFFAAHNIKNTTMFFIKGINNGLTKFYKTHKFNEIKSAMRDYFFSNIDLIGLEEINEICNIFELSDPKHKEILAKICENEINIRSEKNLGIVLKIVRKANLMEKFDINLLIKMAVDLNFIDGIYELIKEDDELVSVLLNILTPKIHKKHIKRIIRTHDLNFKNFPRLLKLQRKSFYSYILHNFDWFKAEDNAKYSVLDLTVLIENLEKRNMFNEAYSIYERNKDKLADIEEFDKYKEYENFQLIQNELYEFDGFSPTSVLKGIYSELSYLKLSDLGLTRSDVHFITSSNLDFALDYLKECYTLGIDCEFYNTECTQFMETRLAIMQIATRSQIYIFDCIELLYNNTFKKFILNLIESPNYTIIGHTFQGDIDVLRTTWKIEHIDDKKIINIDKYFAKYTKYSLARMVNILLNKDLCKFEQTSAWQMRPLREAQIHYAALDAAVLFVLYDNLKNIDSQLTQELIKNSKNSMNIKSIEEKQEFLKLKHISGFEDSLQGKFILNKKLLRLAEQMNNLGFDVVYDENYKQAEIFERAKKENRVVLVKTDKWVGKHNSLNIYKVKDGTVEEQLHDIIKNFKLIIKSKTSALTCITCNKDMEMNNDNSEATKNMSKSKHDNAKTIKENLICEYCGHLYVCGETYILSENKLCINIA